MSYDNNIIIIIITLTFPKAIVVLVTETPSSDGKGKPAVVYSVW